MRASGPIAVFLLLLAVAGCGEDTVVAAGFGASCRHNGDCPFGSLCRSNICTPGDCRDDHDCDDGVFCNGVEFCQPNNDGADQRGCVMADAPCAASQCDESANYCEIPCSVERDADGDGAIAVECGGSDCDDRDPQRYPGAAEVCDAEDHDEDCDPSTFGERDSDGDGFPDARCCNMDAGGTPVCGSDCDDSRRWVNPIVPEVCNGVDDNCDGAADDGVSVTLYLDHDGDGYGQAGTQTQGCAGTAGFAIRADDCDDKNPAIFPGAQVCAAQGMVDVCGLDGKYQTVLCPAKGICHPQANGTGVCL